MPDAIVIGSGPNGLAAAIAIAQAGHSVRVYEASGASGGSTRSSSYDTPGVIHDVGATVHALALASPFMRSLPLQKYGVEFVHPPTPFAHPLDDGSAVAVHRSVADTASSIGGRDGRAYIDLLAPFVEHGDTLMHALLSPRSLRHPILMARFGLKAIQSAERIARSHFSNERAPAMLGGVAAHSVLRLDAAATTGYALGLIMAAHLYGWPVLRGGSQKLADAMIAYLRSLGGEVINNKRVASLDELPPARAILCDVTPRQFLQIAGDRVPARYRDKLAHYRYGPGVFKMDWTLNAPVPWRAAECATAGTVHVGGTFEEMAAAEAEVIAGGHPERPYVLTVQASRFDSARAPAGTHTLWAYCHVPNGSTVNMRERMERQIERFAPGFGDCIVHRHEMSPADLERDNANLVGGDIAGGSADLRQFIARPVLAWDPYATPLPNVYLCSSSTPPGVGVHGMCGFHAAQRALHRSLR